RLFESCCVVRNGSGAARHRAAIDVDRAQQQLSRRRREIQFAHARYRFVVVWRWSRSFRCGGVAACGYRRLRVHAVAAGRYRRRGKTSREWPDLSRDEKTIFGGTEAAADSLRVERQTIVRRGLISSDQVFKVRPPSTAMIWPLI